MTSKDGLTAKDAMTLVTIDDGARLEYFSATKKCLHKERTWPDPRTTFSRLGKMAGNWVLMELGSFFKDQPWDANRVPPEYLADVISHVYRGVVTSPTGKNLLAMRFHGDKRSVAEIVEEESLALDPLSEEEYTALAQTLLEENPDMVISIRTRGQTKKVFWFMGQMMKRAPKGRFEPTKAKEVLDKLLGLAGKGTVE